MTEYKYAVAEAFALMDGDVYRWRYQTEVLARMERERSAGTLYWCEDQQAIVRNGLLLDTYWGGYRLALSGDAHPVRLERVELAFVCNLGDVQYIDTHAVKNFDAADVFDLSYQHGCYKHFVAKAGAKQSADAKLGWIRAKRAELNGDIRARINHLESLARQEARIEAGDTSVSIG